MTSKRWIVQHCQPPAGSDSRSTVAQRCRIRRPLGEIIAKYKHFFVLKMVRKEIFQFYYKNWYQVQKIRCFLMPFSWCGALKYGGMSLISHEFLKKYLPCVTLVKNGTSYCLICLAQILSFKF